MRDNITPNLWFDGNVQEAADFYVSVFPNSRITSTSRYPEGSDKAGEILTVEWELNGNPFVGINGGPQFQFDEAISFQITCDDQDEIDRYSEVLTADGGEQGPCGWVKDRFGLSWQVVPDGMDEIFRDPVRAKPAFEAMMQMRKLDIAALRAAADSVTA
jgi:predicted 3-demethylubiquinone-9 3-methyltransferase (glyoxalase superfamily)